MKKKLLSIAKDLYIDEKLFESLYKETTDIVKILLGDITGKEYTYTEYIENVFLDLINHKQEINIMKNKDVLNEYLKDEKTFAELLQEYETSGDVTKKTDNTFPKKKKNKDQSCEEIDPMVAKPKEVTESEQKEETNEEGKQEGDPTIIDGEYYDGGEKK
jgi:hypothetical protein